MAPPKYLGNLAVHVCTWLFQVFKFHNQYSSKVFVCFHFLLNVKSCWVFLLHKICYVIWQFHPRMKVRYFLMNQIYDLKTLEGLNMIWRLAQDLDQPEFWPCGRLKGPKITNEAQKISYFRHYIHVRKSPDDMKRFK